MKKDPFEAILQKIIESLNAKVQQAGPYETAVEFENAIRNHLQDEGLPVDFKPHPHAFPDIALGEFGVEVKFTEKDTWRNIANSIFEGTKDSSVKHVYLVYGKMGGVPEVKWGKYEDCVMHVRTSHVPRFEVKMDSNRSLFDQMGMTYEFFAKCSIEEKMEHVREYARKRLKPGERLWWLENKAEPEHGLPLHVRIYMNLSKPEKRQLRAEAALLCPQIVKPSRARNKYADAVSYMLTYRGVLCPQARDLFSAGSVALGPGGKRGGNYIQRALADIEKEMLEAAQTLEDSLFTEYWGKSVAPRDRISTWLALADEYAKGWTPSNELFLKIPRKK